MNKIYSVPARLLINCKRLDVILKYLYVKEYMRNDGGEYLKLYKRHISYRTCNQEDNKNSSDDFVRCFNSLIESFEENGFDENYPIVISKVNGLNITGAHRLACALYFDLNVPVVYSEDVGYEWGEEWFNRYKFKRSDIDALIINCLEIKGKTTSFIIWNSLESKFNEIEKDLIGLGCDIYYSSVVNLESGKSIVEFVKDVYSFQDGLLVDQAIENKALRLSKYQSRKIKIIVCNEVPGEKCRDVKNKIRSIYSQYVASDLYTTIHSSDNINESKYIFNLFVSHLNIQRLKQRGCVSNSILSWLIGYEQLLKRIDVPKESTCIVGSSTMDILGLRLSTDLDFILHSDYRDKLYTEGVCKLTSEVDLVTKGYLKPAKLDVSDDTIICNPSYHFYYRGFKFIDIEFVKKRKIAQSREKDINDVKIIKNWENERNVNSKFEIIKYMVWFHIFTKIRYFKNRSRSFFKKWLPIRLIDFLKKIK